MLTSTVQKAQGEHRDTVHAPTDAGSVSRAAVAAKEEEEGDDVGRGNGAFTCRK
jgi:hypothetical protein